MARTGIENENQPLPTNEDTCGPYFPIYFCDEASADLTKIHPGLVVGAAGRPMTLRGHVLDRHGNLANGVVMEFWQANAKGIYRTPSHDGHPDLDPWFDGCGRLRSDDGNYAFRTIKPGATPGRAPNITITIFSDGLNRLVTQVFFDDADGKGSDPLLTSLPESDRSKLIARRDELSAEGEDVYRFDIVMAGPGETPFFDDLES